MQRDHHKRSFMQGVTHTWGRGLLVSILSMILPTLVIGQDAGDITLRFASGQDSITGQLTKFEDGKFFLSASIGVVVIPASSGVTCIGAACPEGTTPKVETSQVVLTAKSGDMSITGDLLEVTNNEFVLATPLGEQRISVDLVDCAGDGCPDIPAAVTADRFVELSNGGITLQGQLIGFEDGTYILDDDVMGQIQVNAAQFSCSGAACP